MKFIIPALCLLCASCATPVPPKVKPVVVGYFPHARDNFTQGLVLHNHALYESTGIYGRSSIQRLSPHKGDLILTRPLPDNQFGEGIAILEDRLYQLTWKAGIAHVYRLPDLAHMQTLRYSGEGWGLTTAEGDLVLSNGTHELQIMTPELQRTGIITVHYQGESVTRLNELEFADGKIYANQWKSPYIYEIDYPSGEVIRIIDCSAIVDAQPLQSKEEVLNGIAYDRQTGLFYITGKNWPRVYKIKLPEPD